jgi:transformation/transcription domain-associated protein
MNSINSPSEDPNNNQVNAESNINNKSPGEHADDLMAILKTGYPLLALSLENMVEHIIHRLRSSPEEDLFRIINTLITETHQVYKNYFYP